MSTLHIKTDIECKVLIYGKNYGLAEPNKYLDIELQKGEYDIELISVRDSSIRKHFNHVLSENEGDYLVVDFLEKKGTLPLSKSIKTKQFNLTTKKKIVLCISAFILVLLIFLVYYLNCISIKGRIYTYENDEDVTFEFYSYSKYNEIYDDVITNSTYKQFWNKITLVRDNKAKYGVIQGDVIKFNDGTWFHLIKKNE